MEANGQSKGGGYTAIVGGASTSKSPHRIQMITLRNVQLERNSFCYTKEEAQQYKPIDVPVIIVGKCCAIVPRDGIYLRSVVKRLLAKETLSLSAIFVPIPNMHEHGEIDRINFINESITEAGGVQINLVMSSQYQCDTHFKRSAFRKFVFAEVFSRNIILFNATDSNMFVLQERSFNGDCYVSGENLAVIGYSPNDIAYTAPKCIVRSAEASQYYGFRTNHAKVLQSQLSQLQFVN